MTEGQRIRDMMRRAVRQIAADTVIPTEFWARQQRTFVLGVLLADQELTEVFLGVDGDPDLQRDWDIVRVMEIPA